MLIGTIKTSIRQFRRRKRVHDLIEDVLRIPDDAVPLSSASISKIGSLKKHVGVNIFSRFTKRGKYALAINAWSESMAMDDLKEAIHDWVSFSDEL